MFERIVYVIDMNCCMKIYRHITLLLFFLLTASCSNAIKNKQQSSSLSYIISIPMEKEAARPIEGEGSQKRPSNYSDCGFNSQARELARLIAEDDEQQRAEIYCNKLLTKIATDKAREMAFNDEVTHQDEFGGPNKRLIQLGFKLSAEEQELFNTVEAILGGYEYPDEVWISFQSSFPHKRHLLGEHPYFKKQSQLGVGYFKKKQSSSLYYWVVYFAKESEL